VVMALADSVLSVAGQFTTVAVLLMYLAWQPCRSGQGVAVIKLPFREFRRIIQDTGSPKSGLGEGKYDASCVGLYVWPAIARGLCQKTCTFAVALLITGRASGKRRAPTPTIAACRMRPATRPTLRRAPLQCHMARTSLLPRPDSRTFRVRRWGGVKSLRTRRGGAGTDTY